MRFLAVLAVLLLAATSASSLEWKTLHLSVKAAPLDRTAQTAFDFTNPSAKTVTITSVDTSCDCVEAAPSAKTFAPGATGQIIARFTLGDRFGSYSRTIIVSTDEGQAPAALTVEIEVPEAATLSPRVVDWKLNAAATEQTIDVTVTPGVVLAIKDVKSTNDAFKCRLETLETGRRYRVHIKPKSTKTGANAAFRLNAKAGTGQELVLSVYANVR